MRPKEITIGIYQFNLIWEDIKANKFKVEKLLHSLPAKPDILFLPEMFTTGFSMNPSKLEVSELEDQKSWMQKLSDSNNTCLAGSIISPRSENKFVNELVATCPNIISQSYTKRHLFFNEAASPVYLKGTNRSVFDIKGVKVCPQICYDLRFPVWSRNDIGYDLLVYSANWPASRQKVWDILMPARAIENQCFVIGVNRIGTDGNGVDHMGGSAVFDANGDCILKLKDEEAYASATISIEDLDSFRKNFPVLKDQDAFSIQIKKG